MATTTNYSWTTPDDTALVKDGAAAIRSLGTAIDTTVFNNAGAAIAKTLIDAKGDLIVGSAADTAARLAVGTNGYTLVADSAEATGLKWAAPAAGALVFIKSQTVGSTVSSVEVTGAFSSTYDNYLIHWNGGVTSASVADIKLTLGATTSGYSFATVNGYYDGSTPNVSRVSNGAYVAFTTGSSSIVQGEALIQSPNLAKITSFRTYTTQGGAGSSTSGFLNDTTQYTAFTFTPGSGTITGGTIYVYGYAKS